MTLDFNTVMMLLNGFGALAESIRTAKAIEGGLSEAELEALRDRTKEIKTGLMDAYDEAAAELSSDGD